MACFHPVKGYRAKRINPITGKRGITFNPSQGYMDLPVTIACGGCIGCRLERSKQWAIRCMHEASMHEHNAFITLTYDDEHLPKDRSLHVEHFQKFMKRLRKANTGQRIRFYHCGEYGEICKTCGKPRRKSKSQKVYCKCKEFIKGLGRPHYHACLFNYDFNDKIFFNNSHSGEKIYISEQLSKLWPFGFSTIGDVTFESAAYVARYITKKVNGPEKEKGHYVRYDTESVGEGVEVHPEYTTCSRRPGIGYAWYQKYRDESYRDDFVVLRGKRVNIPRAYDKIFEKEKVREAQRIKNERKAKARKHEDNNTYERLRDREFCQEQRFKQLKRGIE